MSLIEIGTIAAGCSGAALLGWLAWREWCRPDGT